jgi:hypothetical protein
VPALHSKAVAQDRTIKEPAAQHLCVASLAPISVSRHGLNARLREGASRSRSLDLFHADAMQTIRSTTKGIRNAWGLFFHLAIFLNLEASA